MKYPKRHIVIILTVLVLAVACKKETAQPPKEPASNGPVYHGGKNGWYSRTFFALKNNQVVPARVYLKYAADGPPSDSSLYDEIKNAGATGARFDSLDYGTYYVLLKAGNDTADAIMEITINTNQKVDVFLPLK